MRILQDHYIVLVEKLFETNTTATGILSLSPGYVDMKDEDSNKNRRVYGRVLTCPETFTNTNVSLIDPGKPTYNPYMGSEYIQRKINQGYKNPPRYYPSTFDGFEVITLIDIAKMVDVQVGDKVYFDYICTEPQFFLGKHEGQLMFMVRVDQIYCSVRENWHHNRKGEKVRKIGSEITMQGGWCLVKPEMEDWDEIKTESGIYKKPAPEAKYLRGILSHIRDEREDMRPGDNIIFINDSDAPLKVEGVDYYCMYEDEILCKIKPL